jgi:1-acyl-sn-glycerol-3-phosphate acyltransferase
VASEERAARILELVQRLTAEVHPRASRVSVTLDSPFDDLGIGSLELAELLLRVQDAFGVALPPHVLTGAETPRDLLRAVTRSHARVGADVGVVSPLAEVAGGSAPATALTLIDALDWQVGATPERTHIRILDESGSPDHVTYEALHQEAAAVAAGLLERDVMPGDTVAIMLPTSRAYFITFAGVLLAGAVPVPIYPPARPSQLADHLRRHTGILANARAALLVTVPEAIPLGHLLRANVESLRHVIVPESLMGATGGALPRPRSGDLALVQYTSGSTGQPKGVALTHQNLLANIRAMGQAAAPSGADTFVSWLPLYHDMGLFAWLSSLYFGVPLVVMAPQVFLTRPSRWLRAIHAYRGTISAGPNFAYELCLTKIDDAELQGLDLSCWRLAFNGAEPVSPATIERFTERFARYGLRPEAITPVFGLAECAVGLAFPPLGRGPLIDRVDREVFARSGRADPATSGERDALRFVACGQPLPGHEIRVVDATGHELGDRREGRIEFRGPSATAGYFHNADATRSLFHDDWLDTGDLGYLADADLYVTGRVKDVIIRAGRNLHPDELEGAVGNLAGVRKGCVAVFACADPGGGAERLVVMAETRAADDEAAAELRSEIVSTTVDLLGVAPDDVVLAPPRTVPKTSSGKIRRAASREIYQQGRIDARHRALWWELLRLRLRGAAPSLRRARRAVAAVAFAAYAWGLVAFLAVPVIVLLALLPRVQWRRRVARGAVRLLARLTGTAITAHGQDRLPGGPSIVVANHPSWLDGVVLAMVLPPSFRFVAGEVFQRQVLSGFVLKQLGTEFVERYEREHGVADTDRVVALVRGGQSLVMFPEGHLARAPGLRPFHMGAFVVAAQAGVPAVPIGIRGTRAMLRPEHRFPRRGAVDIAIGQPLQPGGTDWVAAVGLQRAVRDSVLRLSGEPDVE